MKNFRVEFHEDGSVDIYSGTRWIGSITLMNIDSEEAKRLIKSIVPDIPQRFWQ